MLLTSAMAALTKSTCHNIYETTGKMDFDQKFKYYTYKANLRQEINSEWPGLDYEIWVSCCVSR